jgi:hypothetical protein
MHLLAFGTPMCLYPKGVKHHNPMCLYPDRPYICIELVHLFGVHPLFFSEQKANKKCKDKQLSSKHYTKTND